MTNLDPLSQCQKEIFALFFFSFFYFCHPDVSICCLASVAWQMSQTAMVSEARAWQRGQGSSAHPFLLMKPSLIKAKDNYFPDLFCSVATLFLLPTFSLISLFGCFCLPPLSACTIWLQIKWCQTFCPCKFLQFAVSKRETCWKQEW